MLLSSENPHYKIGPRPKIFDRVPLKVEDIKVVLYYNSMFYGVRPGENVLCLATKRLADELNKLPGVVTPRKIIDLRKWQEKGILHLTEREYTKTDIYFMIRWLALTKKDVIFMFVHPQGHLMAKFFMDRSDASNLFAFFEKMKDSDIFRGVNNHLINVGKEPIDWAIV